MHHLEKITAVNPNFLKTTINSLHILSIRYRPSFWRRLLMLFVYLFAVATANSQGDNAGPKTDTIIIPPAPRPGYADPYEEGDNNAEELLITLNVQRIGSLEIPGIILGQKVYLSVKDLFDFLKIRNVRSTGLDSITGFFIRPDAPYLFDQQHNKIIYQDKEYTLSPADLLLTSTALYLRSDYFGKIFGLECLFDFRSLSVNLSTKIELPAIRDMQLELMRHNISQLKGEKKADTVIRRSFPLFNLGMADWLVISTQETRRKTNTRLGLGLGGMLAGGELNVSLNYNSDDTLTMRRQFYQWRYVNNNHAALRQVTAGKIFAQSVSTLYAPVIGVQFTNTPTVFRRSYGTYTLSNTTEPGWMVELYINQVLVNYTKADASGFFTFEVPMVYGNSQIKLRFYGPWGEERTSEKYISIPFNFVPLHQLEYCVTGGIVENDQKSRYARASINYGLESHITIGGGLEYLSTVASGKNMPFLNVSLRLGPYLLASAEQMYGVRSKAVVSYRLPSGLQAELNYLKYDKSQTAIITNFAEEKKLLLSMPWRGKKFTAFSRLTINQFKLFYNQVIPKANNKYTSAEFLFSSVVSGVSSNLTTYAIISDPHNPLVYTNLSLNFRASPGLRFIPQLQYEYRQKNFSMVKAEVEKSLFNRGYLNIAYEKSFINNFLQSNRSLFTIGLRYNFSFAQTYFSATRYNQVVSTTQSARGSLLFDSKTNYVGVSNQSNYGKGGLIILPFVDLNCNGHRESNEPKASGLKLHINGGRIVNNIKDTTIRIEGLESYASYYIELERNSFDNVAWQLRNATISVVIDPNRFKVIEVPVAVVGEVSGTVLLNSTKGLNPLGRIIVNIYNEQGIVVSRLLSESDGYFSYMGLSPGAYTAGIDKEQLIKLGMKLSAPVRFEIAENMQGDVVNSLRFVLQPAGEKATALPVDKGDK